MNVRTIFRLGDYNDDEENLEPSMTDPSQDEPIERLVERMMRGENVSAMVPQFDTTSDLTPAQVFDLQSEVSKDGFDLADAAPIMERAADAAEALKPAPQPSVPPSEEKPVSGAVEAPPASN